VVEELKRCIGSKRDLLVTNTLGWLLVFFRCTSSSAKELHFVFMWHCLKEEYSEIQSQRSVECVSMEAHEHKLCV